MTINRHEALQPDRVQRDRACFGILSWSAGAPANSVLWQPERDSPAWDAMVRTVAAIGFGLLALSCGQEARDVPLVRLLALPQEFDGSRVFTSGYAYRGSVGHVLCPTEADAKFAISQNCVPLERPDDESLWLDLAPNLADNYATVFGRVQVVSGTTPLLVVDTVLAHRSHEELDLPPSRPEGPVASAEDAIEIAEASWKRIFGDSALVHRPVRADLKAGVWHVRGSVVPDLHGGRRPYAAVNAESGGVLAVYYTDEPLP